MNLAFPHKPALAFSVLAIAVLTVISYSNIQNHDFLHWDDIEYVVNNNLLRPFSLDNLVNMFATFDSANWHPITWISYAIDFAIWGESAAAFKWTNVGIHILNSILLLFLTMVIIAKCKLPAKPLTPLWNLAKETRYLAPAIITALFFAVHPQHVESVAWISDRKDLLCTTFYLMATIAYLYSQDSIHKYRWNNLIVLLFLLALMSKSIAVTFPLLLMLLDIYPLQTITAANPISKNIKLIVKNKITLLFLSAIVAVITLITQNSQIGSVEKVDSTTALINASINYLYYFVSIIFTPIISPYHSFPDVAVKPSLFSFAPALLIALIYYSLWKLWKRNIKFPLYSFSAYSIMIIPAVGIIHVGHAARADRYAYLPTIVFYILIGIAIFEIYKRFASTTTLRTLLITSTALCVFYLSIETHSYSQSWKNDELMWKYVLEQYPDSSVTANINLGNYYFKTGDFNKAIEYYQRSIEIDPASYGAYENLAVAYEKLGQHGLAEINYEKMIKANPSIARSYTVIGDYYYKRRNYRDADYYYQQALKLAPGYPNTLLRNGMMDYTKGHLDLALEKIEYALQIDPENIGALQLKIKILMDQNNFSLAAQTAKTLLTLRPNDSLAAEALRGINLNSQQLKYHEQNL